jgi:DNA-binding LacI/PurR family transcriptional regulator
VDRLPFGEQIRKLPMAQSRYDASSDIVYDNRDFIYQTVKHLAQQGCKRISYLRLGPAKAAERKGLEDAARTHGVKAQIVHFDCSSRAGRSPAEAFFIQECETTNFTVKLVERWRRTKRCPDGLIVWEDIGMRAVALGLFKAEVKVPGQMRVVSQANEGIYHNYAVPVVRYETPVTELARQLLRILWKRMNHEDPGPLPVVLRGRIVPEAEKVIA